MEDQTSPLFLLYNIAIAQFLLLIFVVYKKRKNNKVVLLLFLVLILCLIFIIAEFLMTWSGYLANFPYLMGVSHALPFLLGPILYGLVRESESRRIGLIDLLHLIPFLIVIMYQLRFFQYSSVEKLTYYKIEIITEKAFFSLKYIISVFIRALHLGSYVIWVSWHWRKNKTTENLINKSIYIVFLLVSILLIIHGLLLFFKLPMYAVTYCIIIGLFGILGFGLQWIFLFPSPITLITVKYQHSGLPIHVLKKEGLRILERMEKEKPYFNPDLKMANLSEIMELSSHHLSQILNQQLGKNFADFVNEYRI